jgi:hypothetical protein
MWNVGRTPEFMISSNSSVVEICPQTGNPIDIVVIPRHIVIRRFFSLNNNLPHPLNKYKAMGLKGMTETQLESCYNIIKGMRYAK